MKARSTRQDPLKLTAAEVATLAANIRAVRIRSRMSQKKLAATIGVRQQTISDWERGYHVAQLVVAWRLANVLAKAPAA